MDVNGILCAMLCHAARLDFFSDCHTISGAFAAADGFVQGFGLGMGDVGYRCDG